MNPRACISQTFLMVAGILAVVSVVDCFLDFTCFNTHSRININGDNGMWIGGYKSGDDTDASVSFGRTSDTGTSSGLTLPDGSNERDHRSVTAILLVLPAVGGVERIGAFYCNANKDGVDEQITTIIMSSASTIRPRELSQTLSIGQQVTLSVDTDVDVSTLRWRHNGVDFISSLAGEMTYTIENVNPTDAGVYECHQYLERDTGAHAIFQLIVRGCPHRNWNPPSCDRDCAHCFNGGICDERSGQCVCAPGFSGHYCRTVYGRNKWGQDGQLQCAGSDDHTDGCRGMLLCLPHPYGCSCAAGFKGLDCDQECENQMYGADCRQRCHCATGDCLKDTGECDSGQCEADWYGVNCQEYCPASAPEPITNLHVMSTSGDSLSVGWDHYDQCPGFTQYVVEYYLINLDNCMLVNQDGTTVSATTKEYTISGLDYFSTYRVEVKAIRQLSQSATFLSASVSVNKNTDQTVPNAAPTTIEYVAGSNTVTVTWEEIPCGSRRGSGLRYDYRLKFRDGTMFLDWQSTTGTVALFTELTECSRYTFEVRAVNEIGPGEIASTTVNTNAIAPGPVTSSQVLQVSSSSLSVTWAESDSNNCREDSYLIQYRSINIDQCDEEEGEWITMTTTDTISTVVNLLSYSTYEVSITSVLSNVNGETITLTGMTLMSIPNAAPSNIEYQAAPNNISLTWAEIPCGSIKGSGLRYDYRLKFTDDIIVMDWQNTTDTLTVFTALTECSPYTFEVRAVNDIGSGEPASTTVNTEAIAHGPVTSSQMFRVSSSSLRVTWAESDANNCREDSYFIQYRSINIDQCDEEEGEWISVTSTDTTVTLVNLLPYSTYEVSITPVLSNVHGETIMLTGITLMSIPNAAPSKIEYQAAPNNISLTWEDIPCGSIRGSGLRYDYRLKYTDDTMFLDWQSTIGSLAVFTELTECSQFIFEVRAVNNIGPGELVSTTVNTDSAAPGPVTSSQVLQVSSSSLSVTWAESDANNCREDSYLIQYRSINIDQCDEKEGEWITMTSTDAIVTLVNLLPYSTYEVSITPVLSNANGETIMLIGITLMSIPSGPPENIAATEIKSNEITFEWLPPKCGERHGEIMAYSYTLTESYGETVQKQNTTATSIQLAGLKPFTNHTFSVAAITETGSGPDYELVVTTKEAVLGAPTNVRFTNITKYAMTVMWNEPPNSVGLVTGFSVLFFVSAKPYDLSFLPQFVGQHFVNENDPLSFTFSSLLPSTEYLVRITAYAHFGHGDEAVGVQFTQPADKEDMPPLDLSAVSRSIVKVTSSTVTIHIPVSMSEFVTGYHVRIKLDIGFVCDGQIQEMKNFDHYFCSAQSYIAAEILKEGVLKNPEFIIGDNKTYGSYYNPPLKNQNNYLVYIGLISRVNGSIYGVSWSDGLAVSPESTVKRSNEGCSYFQELVAVSVLLCLLLMALFIIIILILLINKRSLKNTNTILQSKKHQNDRNFNDAGEVTMSIEGYVEYKVSQQDISTYHDLDDSCTKNPPADDSAYAYVNDSMGDFSMEEPPNPDTEGVFPMGEPPNPDIKGAFTL